jgi:hypothetical protein
VAFLQCTLALIAAAPAAAFAPLGPTLPLCGTSPTVKLDLSTTSSPGADPYWTVNGKPAFHTPAYSYWSPRGYWIQPTASPTPDPNIPVGSYTYQIVFYIPSAGPYSNLKIVGEYLTDNYLTAFWLNSPSNSGPICGQYQTCWQFENAFSFSGAALQKGLNTITVVVYNEPGYPPPSTPSYSGLAWGATLSATCNPTSHWQGQGNPPEEHPLPPNNQGQNRGSPRSGPRD